MDVCAWLEGKEQGYGHERFIYVRGDQPFDIDAFGLNIIGARVVEIWGEVSPTFKLPSMGLMKAL